MQSVDAIVALAGILSIVCAGAAMEASISALSAAVRRSKNVDVE